MSGGRLALRVPAIRGEPAHGLAMRLAWRCGKDTGAFLPGCGLAQRDLLAGRGAGRLAALADHDLIQLAWWTPAVDAPARSVRLAGQRIALGDWSTSARRWCGECLAEDFAVAAARSEPPAFHVHHRSSWDVRSVAACPRHGASLLSACPACGASQGWGGRLDRCRCGAHLAVPGERLGRAGTSDAFLHRLLTGRTITTLPFPTPHYDDLVRLLERLGAVGVRSHASGRAAAVPAGEARDRGMLILDDWPRAFHRALDAVAGARPARQGLLARYGWVYAGWIKDLPPEPYCNAIREALRSHAVAGEALAADEARLGHVPGAVTLSATAAAGLLGMGYAGMRRLLDREALVPSGARRGVAFPIRRTRLADVIRARGNMVGPSGLASLLGTGRGQARRVAAVIGLSSQGGRYDGVEATRRLARLRGHAVPATEGSSGMRPLPAACKSVGVPLDAACAALAAGALHVYAGEGSGLRGLLVLPAELRTIAHARGMSVEDAGVELGVHHEATRALVRHGHLRRGTNGRGVDRAGVRRFKSDFMPASELARSLGTSPRAAIERLAKSGLRPAIGPPECRAAFFHRHSATRLAKDLRPIPPTSRAPRRAVS